jgi:uncharacterized protein YkwD
MRKRFPELVWACTVLFVQTFALEAAGSEQQTGATADGSGAPPAVRAPGAASGRSGGVAASSRKSLPLDTRSSRSIEAGEALSSAPTGSLNTLQQRVLDRVNYYRTMAGVAPVRADMKLLDAAQSHASYLGATATTGHYEPNKSNPFYTGYSPFDRITARRYSYVAAGEVVASESSTHPARAVDALMAAIYHRFIILSGDYTQAGPGVALNAKGGTELLDVTVDFGSQLSSPRPQESGKLTLYPYDGQQGVPVDFDSAQESPDPMPGHAIVGYPVSVQADPRSTLAVERFDLTEDSPAGSGRPLEARLLARAVDAETPTSAAALIAHAPLKDATTYRVAFSGSVDGQPVSRAWTFTTAASVPVTLTFASPAVAAGAVQRGTLDGLDTEKGPYYLCYSPARLIRSLQHETQRHFAMATTTDCEAGAVCQVTVQATYHSTCSNPFAVGTFNITRQE